MAKMAERVSPTYSIEVELYSRWIWDSENAVGLVLASTPSGAEDPRRAS